MSVWATRLLRIGAREFNYGRTARLQGLLGLVHPGKGLAGKANKFVTILMERRWTALWVCTDRGRTLGVPRRKARQSEH